jgi:DNA/RNA endonuclease YhcR with UshA esterase domain
VNDGENEVEKEEIIRIISHPNPLLQRRGGEIVPLLTKEGLGKILINEILPNPQGADGDGEFVELLNNSGQRINLLNWQLDDMEGGSRPYVINSDAWIDVEEYLMIHRAESGIALNNTFDSVRLFNELEELVDSVEYDNVIEGESYVRGKNGKWFWTEVITPETENIISVSDVRIKDEGISGGDSIDLVKKDNNLYIEIELEKVKDLESGDLVKTKGIVAVLPGVFGMQYFYIVGSPGIQVYSYKKDFPDMEIGDYVEVTGEIAVTNGEKRIKTKTKEDIIKIAKQDEPKPTSYTCEKVSENNVGELVTVIGEIVEQKSSILWLDDGTDEVQVYIKSYTGINSKDYKEGEMVEITGIVSMTKSGLRIMPRSRDDLVKKDVESQDVGRVLGEVAVNDEWEIAKRNKKIELFKYLLIIAGGVIVLLGGLLVKEVRK